ncbi:CheR family methyltransferase [Burkholderia plantarii]|uniref:MCP methyltransferase, CheR-type protein n=1 Tax=Burkholderia plantarii TaxID=41899 RepID=A0A0B6RQZ5_BURPL|nr:CheR family methyltransferase [Burkholderia plantarii]AJK45798.1 MCP methyltransferase, CheR-type protein [Burkholderia plantarii]ALK30048.1 MCP methyltransferase, CheR-type [Burkholderia plantarii]WLE58789.1 protein-glutamate O-methyltransferase CheR [Burkholderia plantarii]GLZ21678.1 chemotaxis protein CheR [Burkholderia plantarii]
MQSRPPLAPSRHTADFDIELTLLLEAIYQKYQHDFRHYAPSSLRRRLSQALAEFGLPTLSQLQDRILRDETEFTRLFQYLTVQVSDMFRDPPYFLALREHVLPLLRTYPSIKVWVAGCSTGEELWSLKILFDEEGLTERTLFYATDISPDALARAEAGIYTLDRIAGFSRNYLAAGGKRSLSDYYHAAYGGARFTGSLRERVVFADHSLSTDEVFLEAHLVSCRNVLIYFDRALQDRALALFERTLVRRGFLGLGSKESLRFSALQEAFGEFRERERIYQKR